MGTTVSKCGPNLLCNLSFMNANVEKVCLSSIDSSTNMIIISANFKYSLSCWVSKALLLIVTHNLVTGLVSKGSAIAFGTWVFMVNLNMHICKSKMLASKGFATCSSEVSPYLFHNNASLWQPYVKWKINLHQVASKTLDTECQGHSSTQNP